MSSSEQKYKRVITIIACFECPYYKQIIYYDDKGKVTINACWKIRRAITNGDISKIPNWCDLEAE